MRRTFLRLSARYIRTRSTVETVAGVASAALGNVRDVYVCLPPAYARSTRRFPVLYMQDGQNLFDPARSFAGSWRVDLAMDAMWRRSSQAIVVGIPNMGPQRIAEYSPWVDAKNGGGRGDAYLDFVADEVKPLIDARYRTLPARAHTGIAGSSMGALLALYAFFARQDVFGFAGILSPSLWFADGAAFPYIEARQPPAGRVYLDVGGREGPRTSVNARLLRDMLVSKGYTLGRDLKWVEDPDGEHNEAAWGRRFRAALPFLLKR
jgi:predicted alpha/beta superfamily hydrolase